MASIAALSLWLLCLAWLGWARSSTGSSVLVVLEPALKQKDYSIFFDGLKDQGHSLTFRAPKDALPLLVDNDIPSFNHVILFAPTTKAFAGDITPQSLVSLLSSKVNLIVALSPTQTPLTTLALEFGLTPPPPETPLISHFPPRSEAHSIIPIQAPAQHAVLSSSLSSTVYFSGVPFSLSNNPRIIPFLNAPAESFAADTDSDAGADAVGDASEKGGEGLWAGSSLGTVVGFQANTNARVTWAGGVSVFSDEFAKRQSAKGVSSGNAAFCREVAAWTFQEINVLRIDNATHYRAGEKDKGVPSQYTINENTVYEIQISQFNPKTGSWAPYSGLTDLQLEFTMLDPHIRTSINAVKDSPGLYRVAFRVPDRHGVFKFVVDYKRKGYSYLFSSTTVSVVPPRHDGYPRFLSAAWPYYAGAISTSVAFVVFCALWLGGDVSEGRGKKTKGKTE